MHLSPGRIDAPGLAHSAWQGSLRVAGVLSGTSADGIDVGLAAIEVEAGRAGPPRLLAFETVPYTLELGARVRAALDGAPTGLRAAALLHRDLGLAFGRAAAEVAARQGVELDLVGSHGQTLWHHDGDPVCGPATLQLGDGDHLAAACGCAVVSDFRQAELAAGGQGAPLSGYADGLVFAQGRRPLVILNLGGLGNLTYLGPGGELLAFDTGPAGALLDGLARRLLEAPMDRGGKVAASGRVLFPLVQEFLAHDFFQQPLPRSTGRDTFDGPWVEAFLAAGLALGGRPADLLASAVECVAASVAQGLRDHVPAGPTTLWVAGGGVHHRPLMAALERLGGLRTRSVRGLGVDPDAREALVFAVLAALFVTGEPVLVSGAESPRPALLGRWSPAPPAILR